MEIRVLGPLEVVVAAQPLDLGGPRQRTVLARLLLDADREVSVDALVDAVWLDRPPTTAVKTLRGYVSRLRHVLATTPIRIDGSARGYMLVAPEGCIDARRFAAAAAVTAADAAALATVLNEALGLWRGPPWAGFADDPAFQPDAERLLELKGAVWERLFDAELTLGGRTDLVAELKAAIAAFPFRERLRGQLALALYAAGRQVDALQVLRVSATYLRDELGLDPSPELERLEEQILRHDPALGRQPAVAIDDVVVLVIEIIGAAALARAAGANWGAARVGFGDLIVRIATTHRGTLLGETADGMALAFDEVDSAMTAAVAVHEALRCEVWPGVTRLTSRMGMHVGAVQRVRDHYVGAALHETTRVAELAGPGQVLVTGIAAERFTVTATSLRLEPLGALPVPDLPEPVDLHLVDVRGFDAESDGPWQRVRRGDGAELIGREAAVAQLRSLVLDNRLVTVVGAGGSGKSRIAIDVAARSPGELHLVELASTIDTTAVCTRLADALQADGTGEPMARILERLGSRRALLVLDNCEHLLTAVAEVCREIVTHCPRVRILATSREPLRLRAERVWPIPRLSSAAAVELFVERARSARADFDPTADDHLAIQRICEQVDRLPLAIELAAARVRSLSVRDITDRLDDLVELLAGQVDDRAARHQTMQTTIDWSVSSLGPTERQLLDEMVMFAGGARLDAIESVSSTANTTDVLDGLVAKSLVEFDPGRAAADRREPRYLVLEPIRQYVEAELKTTDALELATVHATWVVGLARHASQELASQPAQWTTLLDAETANVAKAFRFLLTAGRVSECMQIVAGLGQYWFSRLSADGYRMSGEVLAAARGDETPRLRAGVLLTAGLLAEQAGDLRQAIDHLACAIELLGPLDTSPRLAWALFHQARVLALSGLADPHRPLGKAVVLFRQLGDPVGEAWCALWLAQTTKGDLRSHWISEVLRLGRDPRGRPMLAAVLYHFAGPEALARGDAELASLHFDEAIELCRAAGDRSNELSTWLGAALAFLEHDQALAALRFLKGSTGPIATHGTTYQRRLVLLLIADVARRHGEAELAAQLRTSACTGTTAFSIHVTEHSTPHNRMVAALMARLPADEIEPLPLDQAFDRACRWLARLPSLDSRGSVPHV